MSPNPMILIPQRIDEDIAENDSVRMVDALVEGLEPSTKEDKSALKKKRNQLKELEKNRDKLEECDQHLDTLQGHNSYSKTDKAGHFYENERGCHVQRSFDGDCGPFILFYTF